MSENSFLGTETRPDYIPTSDEKTMAILSHILNLVAPIVAPLIIYLIKKDESPFIASHSRESLNFQITVMLACAILFITVIGLLFIWVVGIFSLICVVIATIRASEGKLYRYPMSLRLIK